MRTFDIIKNGILEKIFDNTADKINCECFNIFDPEFVIDSAGDKYLFYSKTYDETFGHVILLNSENKKVKVTYITNDGLTGYYKHLEDKEFVGIINEKILDESVSQQIEPVKMKIWNNILAKYNIECVNFKEFKKIFTKKKNLSLDQIYNQHLSFDNKIAVMSEDIATLIYHYNNEIDYPIFLIDQENVERIAAGYQELKKENPDIDKKHFENELVMQNLKETHTPTKTKQIKIKIKQIDILKEIIDNKIEQLFKNKYYFHSTNYEDQIELFLHDNNIKVVSEISLEQNFSEKTWNNKEANSYCFFKNLHLLDLQRNSRDKIERPDCGWVCVPYKVGRGEYLFVPKNLAAEWLQNIN
jgi:hypothetical protein